MRHSLFVSPSLLYTAGCYCVYARSQFMSIVHSLHAWDRFALAYIFINAFVDHTHTKIYKQKKKHNQIKPTIMLWVHNVSYNNRLHYWYLIAFSSDEFLCVITPAFSTPKFSAPRIAPPPSIEGLAVVSGVFGSKNMRWTPPGWHTWRTPRTSQ